ncbi:Two component regulator propeller [Prevotellaceae bacterium MN60]|nr:Two component regulator propeller [Prevotellaceae bacterium MN60]
MELKVLKKIKEIKTNAVLVKRLIVFLPLYLFIFLPLSAQIGSWRNYLSYAEVQQIQAAGDNIFVMASNSLYQYNLKDQSIVTFDKTNGMSDVDIKQIRWCKQAKRLVVVYSNSNIDLIETNGNIINISDLYTKSIIGDKTVSSIRIDGVYAYLICGFGIVKLNVQRAEIADSYTKNHPDYPTSLPAEDNSDYDKYIDVVKTLQPGGPKYNWFYESKFVNGKLYTTGGQFLSGIVGMGHPGTIQVFDGNNWTLYPQDINNTTGFRYVDINCIDVDPTDPTHIAVGGRSGLYEFKNGILKAYHYKDNSPLRPAWNHTNNEEHENSYTLVHGIKYDSEGNLWVLNSQAKDINLLQLTKDGQWKKFTKTELYNKNKKDIGCEGLRSAFIDSRGLLWFVNTSWDAPAVFCYDIWMDTLYKYDSFINQDGVSYNTNALIYDITEDKRGNIWIATNKAIFYFSKEDIENFNFNLYQEKIPRNDGTDYADYLLTGLSSRCIKVDGGGRKWVGTEGNGLFLISEDNMTQVHHFTTSNSPLISDNILDVSINGTTGEVFILTDKGLCSYMSNATTPNEEMTTDNVWAYPNPVTPDYTGLITITGLSYDADVKILSTNGALMAEGRSNGGTFTWDGCDRNGNRVASGIYMVVTATSNGDKGTVCKIAIVR